MSGQVQELINKIKSEGVEAANAQAQEIESQAKIQAKEIIQKAQKEAETLIAKAKEEISKIQKSSEMAIKQSSRDMIISLKKEINDLLKGLIQKEVKETLSTESLGAILGGIISRYMESNPEVKDVCITLSDKELKSVEDGFLAKLQKKIKTGVMLKGSDDIDSGFTISFDAGKSFFDFTDKSLVEYLSANLNPTIEALLNQAVEGNE